MSGFPRFFNSRTRLGGDDLELHPCEGEAVEDGRDVVKGRRGREDAPGGQPSALLGVMRRQGHRGGAWGGRGAWG